MLLAKATIGSTVYRFSNRQHNLAKPWRNRIKRFDIPARSTDSAQGGWLRWNDGRIVMYPSFSPTWPPPETFALEVYNSEDGQTMSQWFDGAASISDSDFATEVPYRLYGGAFEQTVAKDHLFSGTLAGVCSWAAGQLGLTLNSTLSRSPSTPIYHTMQRDARITDVLDALCKYATHLYWIDNATATLHLLDMEQDNGTRSLNDSHVFNPTFPKLAPVAEMTARVNDSDVVRMGAADGRTVRVQPYHTNTANVRAELDRAIALLNARRISVEIPLTNDIPAPGERITFTTTKAYQPTSGWFRVRQYEPIPAMKKIRISGEGSIA